MKQGFVKVAPSPLKIVVADTKENTALICAEIKKGREGRGKDHCAPGTLYYGLYMQ